MKAMVSFLCGDYDPNKLYIVTIDSLEDVPLSPSQQLEPHSSQGRRSRTPSRARDTMTSAVADGTSYQLESPTAGRAPTASAAARTDEKTPLSPKAGKKNRSCFCRILCCIFCCRSFHKDSPEKAE